MRTIKVAPARLGFSKWVLEVEIADAWVMDGFELTAERAHSIFAYHLEWAEGSEIRTKVLHAPPQADIRKLQGYDPKEKS